MTTPAVEAAARRLIERTTAAQNLPALVADQATLRSVAVLVDSTTRGGAKRARPAA